MLWILFSYFKKHLPSNGMLPKTVKLHVFNLKYAIFTCTCANRIHLHAKNVYQMVTRNDLAMVIPGSRTATPSDDVKRVGSTRPRMRVGYRPFHLIAIISADAEHQPCVVSNVVL